MRSGQRLAPLLLLAPGGVFGIVFFALPLVAGAGLSFTNWSALAPARFVGFANYAYLLSRDPDFWPAARNTAVFAVCSIAITVPLALAGSLGLRGTWGASVWRSAYFVPGVVSVVAVAYVWQSVLADPYGLVNRLLAGLGVAGPAWLHDPDWAMVAIVVVYAWVQVGQDMMILFAAIETLDPDVSDAARLDGAGPWRLFWHVTLPLLRPAVLFILTTGLIRASGFFALMLVLTDGGPAGSTEVLALHIYKMAFGGLRLGMACAASYLLLAATLVAALAQVRLLRDGGLAVEA